MKILKLIMVLSLTLISIISYCPPMGITWTFLERKLEKAKEIHVIAYTLRELEGGHKYFKDGKPLPGASGEQGVYQFMPSTWNRLCKKFFNEILEKTKDNQDMVAYMYLESLLDKKYTIKQIASIWNSGNPNSNAEGINKYGVPYSVPKYKAKFMAIYNKVKKDINMGNLSPFFVANSKNGLYIYILMQNNKNINRHHHEDNFNQNKEITYLGIGEPNGTLLSYVFRFKEELQWLQRIRHFSLFLPEKSFYLQPHWTRKTVQRQIS